MYVCMYPQTDKADSYIPIHKLTHNDSREIDRPTDRQTHACTQCAHKKYTHTQIHTYTQIHKYTHTHVYNYRQWPLFREMAAFLNKQTVLL